MGSGANRVGSSSRWSYLVINRFIHECLKTRAKRWFFVNVTVKLKPCINYAEQAALRWFSFRISLLEY